VDIIGSSSSILKKKKKRDPDQLRGRRGIQHCQGKKDGLTAFSKKKRREAWGSKREGVVPEEKKAIESIRCP